MDTSKGMTLVELMVALVVFAILASVALPSLATLQSAYRADARIREIETLVKLARSYAISYGVRVRLCPLESGCCTNDWSKGFSVFSDTGTTACLDGIDVLIHNFPAIDAKDTLKYSRTSLRFMPDGLASGTNGTFKFCPDTPSSPSSKSIVISNAGRVRWGSESVNCN